MNNWWTLRWNPQFRVTLFARCLFLMVCEVAANGFVWILTVIVFSRNAANKQLLSLALIAWTTGLRHALDADHISAIDNATRRIVAVPRLKCRHTGQQPAIRRPVTVGLFFSLGHSTIVIATTVAIAVSASVADHLGGVNNVGGIIGSAVSGSFLFLIGCINSVILARTWIRLRRLEKAQMQTSSDSTSNVVSAAERDQDAQAQRNKHFTGCMTRMALPLLKMVNRPWKMYPVGVLFGLGFDTASSIALLSVAAIAMRTARSHGSANGDNEVILLSLLFTAGMTMIDSADSCLMIWAYAPESPEAGRSVFAIFKTSHAVRADPESQAAAVELVLNVPEGQTANNVADSEKGPPRTTHEAVTSSSSAEPPESLQVSSRINAPASKLSLVLTLLSITVAFVIGSVVLLGLIGQECSRCAMAASKTASGQDGGLEGRWWLTWQEANDNFGYIGAVIVGAFAFCLLVWAAVSAIRKRLAKRRRG